jgi:hypothetical protein
VPPSQTGGNIDNWRIGKGAAMYYPVSVPGALLSVGDPHASQGDSELCGTAIECSLTGTFQLILHKAADLLDTPLQAVDFPMIETPDEWVLQGFSYPNYLADLGPNAQSDIFQKSSVDLAMRDAFRKMRRFLMTRQEAHRGRGDQPDVDRGRFRHHPGRRWKLGRARDRQEEHLSGLTQDAADSITRRRPGPRRAAGNCVASPRRGSAPRASG